MFKHELGSKAKSNINGFSGIISSRAEHLNGCNRYWIEPEIDKKTGNKRDGTWVDEGELVIVKKAVLKRTNTELGGFQSSIK
jgi:hypothetical protein